MWADRLSSPERMGSGKPVSSFFSSFWMSGRKVAWMSLAAHKVKCTVSTGESSAPLRLQICSTSARVWSRWASPVLSPLPGSIGPGFSSSSALSGLGRGPWQSLMAAIWSSSKPMRRSRCRMAGVTSKATPCSLAFSTMSSFDILSCRILPISFMVSSLASWSSSPCFLAGVALPPRWARGASSSCAQAAWTVPRTATAINALHALFVQKRMTRLRTGVLGGGNVCV